LKPTFKTNIVLLACLVGFVELVLVELLCELYVKEVVCLAVSQGDPILSSGGKIGVFLENSQHFEESK
jgi:hypothetical protein